MNKACIKDLFRIPQSAFRNPQLSYSSTPQPLARMFYELVSRDHADGRATWQPQGVGSEAYLSGTSQGPTSEDAREGGHIRGRSNRFMKHSG